MFQKLPIEIKEKVFQNMNHFDLLNCRLVCQEWNAVIQEMKIFKEKTQVCLKPGYSKKLQKVKTSREISYQSLKLSSGFYGYEYFKKKEILKIVESKVINLEFVKSLILSGIVIKTKSKLRSYVDLLNSCPSIESIEFSNVQISDELNIKPDKYVIKLEKIKSLLVYEYMGILQFLKLKRVESLSFKFSYRYQLDPTNEKMIIDLMNGLEKVDKILMSNVNFNSNDLVLKPQFKWKELTLLGKNISYLPPTNVRLNWKRLMKSSHDSEVNFHLHGGDSFSTFYFLVLNSAFIKNFNTFTLDLSVKDYRGFKKFIHECRRLFSENYENQCFVRNLRLLNSYPCDSRLIPVFFNKFFGKLKYVENLHVELTNFGNFNPKVVRDKFSHVKHLVINRMDYQTSHFIFEGLKSIKIKVYEKEADSDHFKHFAKNHRMLIEFKIDTNISPFDSDINFHEIYKLMPHVKIFCIGNLTMTKEQIEKKLSKGIICP